MGMSRRGCSVTFGLTAALCFCLACGCDDDGGPATTGAVSGVIAYSGSKTGTHTLWVSVLDDTWQGGGQLVAFGSYTVSDVALAAGHAYTVAGIPPGTYYIHAYWDANDDFLGTVEDPSGDYGGSVSPLSFDVAAGAVTPDVDIDLLD